MTMAHNETTFEDFQTDERFKKLERSLKLAMLKKVYSDDGEILPVATNQPSISSINADSLDSCCVAPSLQNSVVRSEVLASSNNLRNLLLTNKSYKTNQKMITSSVKQYDTKQDYLNERHIMPPPMRNTVYRTFKERPDSVSTLSNYEIASKSLNYRNAQFSTVNNSSLKNAASSSNINTNEEQLYSFVASISTNDPQRVDRTFSKWRVMLNDRYELIIKGTLECGLIARSKPIIRRYSATCVESKYKHKYSLQGNIFDERNVLPNYIYGKFYNGFPDDWENVYQIWRTYISKGCPVTFRWPTPITDSDDDLKSELTELTYIRTNNKVIPKENYESIKSIKSENLSNKSSKNEKKYNCSTHSFQRPEENTSFVKPLISKPEENIIPIAQTRNIKLPHNENQQNMESYINPLDSSKGMDKLKDIIHEDKLNIIINNLADRNCSPKYIDKIIEMFECLDYVISYRAKSEYNDDSAVFVNCGTSSKVETILQSNPSCNDNHMNINKIENNTMEQCRNCMHSTNLEYKSIKNDSNSMQLSNPINIKRHKNNNASDESESETYAGVPKISKLEQILHTRKIPRKIYKHKVRKTSAKPQCNAKGIEYEFESVNTLIPTVNNNKTLLCDKSDISITEDEVKVINMKKCHEIINIAPKENTFYRHPGIQRNNVDVFGVNKSTVQNKKPLDSFEAQKVNLNVFGKEQKILHRVQENAHLQSVADIDYATNSDIDVATISTNTEKKDRNMITSHFNLDQDIVINNESNSNFSEKPVILQELHREFIEQTNNETVTKRPKPNIISLMPVNLKLSIKKADSKSGQLQASDISIIENEEDKQYTNIQPSQEIQKKKSVLKTSIIATKTTNYLKMAADDEKKIYPTTKKENEVNINPTNLKPMTTNSTIEQSKSNELEIENKPKMLCAWMPKVIYYEKSKSELGLIFEGKLLNEAGHVVHRKFTTDIVLKRLSATLIETVNHEFYELFGHLKDNKYVIPKELAKQCRNGCPANIEQFCLTWKRLQNCKIQKINEKSHNTIDLLNTSVSSRGRRIVPPLCYWTGERITMKDNSLIYDQGNSKELSLHSSIETSQERLNVKESKKLKVNSNNTSKEKKLLSKSNEIPDANKNQTIVVETNQFSKSPKPKTKRSTNRSYKSNKFRKLQMNGKQRTKQKFSLSDSEEEQTSLSKRVYTRPNTEVPSQYTMTLRRRYSPTKKSRCNITSTYYKNALSTEDFLSEVTSM